MKRDLEEALPGKQPFTVPTISRALDEMLITMMLAEDVPDAKNVPRTLEKHYEYANWSMAEGVVGHYVFIDECKYNIWTRRSFA